MPVDPRDVNMPDLLARRADGRAALPESRRDVLAAARRRLEHRRRRSHLAARRLRPLLHAQQSAGPDRHGHEPAGDAARGHRQPDVSGAAVRARRRHLGAADPVRHRLPARPHVERQPGADACGTTGWRRSASPERADGISGATPTSTCRADHPRRRDAVLSGRPDASQPELLGDRAEVERRRLLVQGADPGGAPAVEPRAAGADVLHLVEVGGHDAERHVLLGFDDQPRCRRCPR